ncbi:MAG TPA: FAD/NAD(P)-binding protein [Dictyobacter sp.]|nr:FAD/NAD(P)-binding protein [Dictyobacter sp.]
MKTTDNPMLPRLYHILHRQKELANTFTFILEPCDNATAPAFASGQFNMLYIFGIGEIPLSISGDPTHTDLLIHTVRSVGNVSQATCALKPQDIVGIRGPFGNPWPIEQARGKDLLLIAGGLGLAPLRPVMYQILAQREQYRNVTLLYGARTPEDILYRKECESWRAHLDLDIAITVDRAPTTWRGSIGVVTRLIPRAHFEPQNTIAFICGPEIMMRFSATELEKQGIATEAIYVSMERNMKCAIGFCGHCQYGSAFICKDGPVLPYSHVRNLFFLREI